MSVFYDRAETGEEVVITYRPYSWYVIFLLFVGSLVAGDVGTGPPAILKGVLWACFAALLLVRFFVMRGVNSEVRRAMKGGSVVMSGSAFNAKNPLTARIRKSGAGHVA
jgi:hypothetical protein